MKSESEAVALREPQTLAEIQRSMMRLITNRLTNEQTIRDRLEDGSSSFELAATFSKPNDRLSSVERIEIYNKQYWFRLIDCLYDDFPGVRYLLGDSKFYDLLVGYLHQYPSSGYSLRDLGSRLPKFIDDDPHWGGRRREALRDMVRFEWAQIEAFDGPALPPLAQSALAVADPYKLFLKLQPYITLLALRYPFDDLIISLKRELRERSEASSDRAHEELLPPGKLPTRKNIFVAVHRHHNVLHYKRVDPVAFVVLNKMRDGTSLGEACETLAEEFIARQRNEELADAVRDWFANWSALGWLVLADEYKERT